jgi:hypothetical protein
MAGADGIAAEARRLGEVFGLPKISMRIGRAIPILPATRWDIGQG